MNVSELLLWDRAHVWHPYTRASSVAAGELPLIVRGEGIYLFDGEGRRYVDAISSWWCCALGHAHPRIVAAIQKQAALLPQSILGNLAHPQAAELAHKLARLMPSPDRHILFAGDGASAVEQALKIAVQYQHAQGHTKRQRFACIADAYHGDTIGAMAVGYQDAWHKPFKPMFTSPVVLPVPKADANGKCPLPMDLLTPHARDLAAVIVEPLCLGAAGMKMYPACWLSELAAWCKQHGVLLIDDEIAMGFGRTGRMFAFEHASIDPDLVCVGKALAAGHIGISATIAKDSIYQLFDDNNTLQHGHTFCGNPIAAAAANEALRVYAEMNITRRAQELGELLREELAPLAAHPRVAEVRTLGMIGVVELHPESEVKPTTRPHRIRLRLQREGILLRPLGNVLYLMPPLIIEPEQLRDLIRHFAGAIAETE